MELSFDKIATITISSVLPWKTVILQNIKILHSGNVHKEHDMEIKFVIKPIHKPQHF